jgi:phosphate starvation-inducible membrane PsiE
MEKHIMRVSYGLCLLCAVLALITRGLIALKMPAQIFTRGGNYAIGYHAFVDGVLLFFIFLSFRVQLRISKHFAERVSTNREPLRKCGKQWEWRGWIQ